VRMLHVSCVNASQGEVYFPVGSRIFTSRLSPGVKRQRREAHHSPQSNAEVKNVGSIHPFAHTSSWRSACLSTERERERESERALLSPLHASHARVSQWR
jgi:hypothetical protein